MGLFRFHLIGAQPVLLEVAAQDIGELGALITRQRFVEGRLAEPDCAGVLAEPDCAGVLAGVLVATSRIQCVIEVS